MHVRACYTRLRKHSLELDIRISWVHVDLQNQKFPVLQPCDAIRFMVAHDEIGRLVGNISRPHFWHFGGDTLFYILRINATSPLHSLLPARG